MEIPAKESANQRLFKRACTVITTLLILIPFTLLHPHNQVDISKFIVDSYPVQSQPSVHSQSVINFSTNAFFLHYPTPLALIAHLMGIGFVGEMFFITVVFLIGLFAIQDQRTYGTTLGCALFTVSLLICFRFDTPLWHALAFLPWQYFGLQKFKNPSTQRAQHLITALIFTLAAFEGGWFALPIAAVVLALHPPPFRWGAILLVPALLVSLRPDLPTFPDYPPFAQVVSGYGTDLGVTPKIAGQPLLVAVDHAALRAIYVWPAIILTLLTALLWISKQRDRLIGIGFFLSVTLVLAVLLPPAWAQQSPLPVLMRILPGLALLPLHGIVLALAAFFIFLSVARHTIASTCVLTILSLFALYTSYSLQLPEALSSYETWQSSASTAMRKLFSPSYAIIRENKLAPDSQRSTQPFNFRSLRPAEIIEIRSNPVNAAPLSILFDGDLQKRISFGAQQREQSVTVFLAAPILIRAVKIDLGPYSTDFPRGVALFGTIDCSPASPLATLPLLYATPVWHGALFYTPHGYPYYGPQSEVILELPNPQPLQCLTITQLSYEPHFDWSITEIRVSE